MGKSKLPQPRDGGKDGCGGNSSGSGSGNYEKTQQKEREGMKEKLLRWTGKGKSSKKQNTPTRDVNNAYHDEGEITLANCAAIEQEKRAANDASRFTYVKQDDVKSISNNDHAYIIDSKTADGFYSDFYPISPTVQFELTRDDVSNVTGSSDGGVSRSSTNSIERERSPSTLLKTKGPLKTPPSWPLPQPKIDDQLPIGDDHIITQNQQPYTYYRDQSASPITSPNNAVYAEISEILAYKRQLIENSAALQATSQQSNVDKMLLVDATFPSVGVDSYNCPQIPPTIDCYHSAAPQSFSTSINHQTYEDAARADVVYSAKGRHSVGSDEVFFDRDPIPKDRRTVPSLGSASPPLGSKPSCGIMMARLRATRHIYSDVDSTYGLIQPGQLLTNESPVSVKETSVQCDKQYVANGSTLAYDTSASSNGINVANKSIVFDNTHPTTKFNQSSQVELTPMYNPNSHYDKSVYNGDTYAAVSSTKRSSGTQTSYSASHIYKPLTVHSQKELNSRSSKLAKRLPVVSEESKGESHKAVGAVGSMLHQNNSQLSGVVLHHSQRDKSASPSAILHEQQGRSNQLSKNVSKSSVSSVTLVTSKNYKNCNLKATIVSPDDDEESSDGERSGLNESSLDSSDAENCSRQRFGNTRTKNFNSSTREHGKEKLYARHVTKSRAKLVGAIGRKLPATPATASSLVQQTTLQMRSVSFSDSDDERANCVKQQYHRMSLCQLREQQTNGVIKSNLAPERLIANDADSDENISDAYHREDANRRMLQMNAPLLVKPYSSLRKVHFDGPINSSSNSNNSMAINLSANNGCIVENVVNEITCLDIESLQKLNETDKEANTPNDFDSDQNILCQPEETIITPRLTEASSFDNCELMSVIYEDKQVFSPLKLQPVIAAMNRSLTNPDVTYLPSVTLNDCNRSCSFGVEVVKQDLSASKLCESGYDSWKSQDSTSTIVEEGGRIFMSLRRKDLRAKIDDNHYQFFSIDRRNTRAASASHKASNEQTNGKLLHSFQQTPNALHGQNDAKLATINNTDLCSNNTGCSSIATTDICFESLVSVAQTNTVPTNLNANSAQQLSMENQLNYDIAKHPNKLKDDIEIIDIISSRGTLDDNKQCKNAELVHSADSKFETTIVNNTNYMNNTNNTNNTNDTNNKFETIEKSDSNNGEQQWHGIRSVASMSKLNADVEETKPLSYKKAEIFSTNSSRTSLYEHLCEDQLEKMSIFNGSCDSILMTSDMESSVEIVHENAWTIDDVIVPDLTPTATLMPLQAANNCAPNFSLDFNTSHHQPIIAKRPTSVTIQSRYGFKVTQHEIDKDDDKTPVAEISSCGDQLASSGQQDQLSKLIAGQPAILDSSKTDAVTTKTSASIAICNVQQDKQKLSDHTVHVTNYSSLQVNNQLANTKDCNNTQQTKCLPNENMKSKLKPVCNQLLPDRVKLHSTPTTSRSNPSSPHRKTVDTAHSKIDSLSKLQQGRSTSPKLVQSSKIAMPNTKPKFGLKSPSSSSTSVSTAHLAQAAVGAPSAHSSNLKLLTPWNKSASKQDLRSTSAEHGGIAKHTEAHGQQSKRSSLTITKGTPPANKDVTKVEPVPTKEVFKAECSKPAAIPQLKKQLHASPGVSNIPCARISSASPPTFSPPHSPCRKLSSPAGTATTTTSPINSRYSRIPSASRDGDRQTGHNKIPSSPLLKSSSAAASTAGTIPPKLMGSKKLSTASSNNSNVSSS